MQSIHSGFDCFCWAWPFFLFCCWFCVCLLSDETQIWLGDLRVVVCGSLFVFFWLFPLFVDCCTYTATVLCTFLAFTTSTSVRTEPQATSAAPEGEKKRHWPKERKIKKARERKGREKGERKEKEIGKRKEERK